MRAECAESAGLHYNLANSLMDLGATPQSEHPSPKPQIRHHLSQTQKRIWGLGPIPLPEFWTQECSRMPLLALLPSSSREAFILYAMHLDFSICVTRGPKWSQILFKLNCGPHTLALIQSDLKLLRAFEPCVIKRQFIGNLMCGARALAG